MDEGQLDYCFQLALETMIEKLCEIILRAINKCTMPEVVDIQAPQCLDNRKMKGV